jgi:tRNA-specific 2-thiouridylase
VVAVNPAANEVVVGSEEELFADTLIADRVNLIAAERLTERQPVLATVRYRHPAQEATITPLADGRVRVHFSRSVRAITPGQAVVVYDREKPDLVVGGGTIREVCRRMSPEAVD